MTHAANPEPFLRRLDALDTSLFDGILSQTTEEERASLLALQRATRRVHASYVYLEIGSYLGGTIQPHLRDPACRRIYSIDKRPRVLPDQRDGTNTYEDNSTDHMLALLGAVAPEQMDKLACFEGDARAIDPVLIREPPHLCFIDGEHTHPAVISDFAFCLQVCAPDAVIAFHDAARVFLGIEFIQRTCHVPFTPLRLGGTVYAIALGQGAIAQDDKVHQLAMNGTVFLQMLKLRAFYQSHIPASLRQRLKFLMRPIATQLPR